MPASNDQRACREPYGGERNPERATVSVDFQSAVNRYNPRRLPSGGHVLRGRDLLARHHAAAR